MCKRKSASRRERGLVLVELLVAGCVLAILAALAAPAFTAISERLKLRSASAIEARTLPASKSARRPSFFTTAGKVTSGRS